MIGFDESLLEVLDESVRKRQALVYKVLGIMLVVISLLSAFSAIICLLVVFQNWLVALPVGLMIGILILILYKLLVITALEGSQSVLGDYMADHEKHISEHVGADEDLTALQNFQIEERVSKAKQILRDKRPHGMRLRSGIDSSEILTMTLRVVMLSVIGLIVATGLEIFIFRDAINEILAGTKSLYEEAGDSWFVENILTPAEGRAFYVVESNSMLLVLNVLELGLGYWKLFFDFLVLVVYMAPLALVFRCVELSSGPYMKEFVLDSVSKSFKSRLIIMQACQMYARKTIEEYLIQKKKTEQCRGEAARLIVEGLHSLKENHTSTI
jgi:hypothetical protein